MSALPLVLLHGWGAHAGVWGELIAHMDLGHTVIAPDIPECSDAVSTLDQVVDRIAAAVPERCVIAGWSLGGQLALAWAHRHPQQVAKLILISTTPRFVAAPDWLHGMDVKAFNNFCDAVSTDSAAALRRFVLLETQGDMDLREVTRKLEVVLASRAAADQLVLLHTLGWLRDTDLRPVLPAIRQPSWVIHGDRDRITPPGAAEYLVQQLPDARLAWMHGHAHAPFISDPAAFGRMITEFCNE